MPLVAWSCCATALTPLMSGRTETTGGFIWTGSVSSERAFSSPRLLVAQTWNASRQPTRSIPTGITAEGVKVVGTSGAGVGIGRQVDPFAVHFSNV